jgi:hypothetical protein
MTSPITPSNGSCRGLLLTPGSRVLKTPLSDETIWKRLKEDGFDEESIKRRDKAAIIVSEKVTILRNQNQFIIQAKTGFIYSLT